MEHECHKEEIINGLDKAINGNGQPGLRDTVAKLTISVDGLNRRLDRMDQRSQFNITTVISIAAFILAVAVAIMKKI